MENIYQQAIADAKALRASAMANAKSALQEAFEPKITEMVRLKLSEELEEVDELEEAEDLEEMQDYEQGLEEVDETIDESGLDEILAELEELANEGEHEGLNEAEGDEDEDDEDDEEDDEEKLDDEESEVEDAEEDIVDDETKVIDITIGDLKKVFQSLQAQEAPEMDATDLEADEEEAPEGDDTEEPFSLDEILAELENEGKDEIYEKKEKKKDDEEKHKMKEELNEAKKAIKQLQESFTEVNLLNAKLLYMNKLFKAKNLSESEKIRVVKAFDRASSVKEVKNTFDVLKESIETKKKSRIQESFGYASKPAGVSPSNNVIESDPFVSRWQKIAGI